jgi:hypothetical protein
MWNGALKTTDCSNAKRWAHGSITRSKHDEQLAIPPCNRWPEVYLKMDRERNHSYRYSDGYDKFNWHAFDSSQDLNITINEDVFTSNNESQAQAEG